VLPVRGMLETLDIGIQIFLILWQKQIYVIYHKLQLNKKLNFVGMDVDVKSLLFV
jgi:hypothetical protein